MRTDTLGGLLAAHYAGEATPALDYLLDMLPDGHPDVELARSGVWRGTLAEWLEVGPGIVRRVPLVSVEVTDRKPRKPEMYIGKRRIAWWPWDEKRNARTTTRGEEDLPHDWFEKSEQQKWHYYDTDELALADASQRAIAWARRTDVTP